MSDILKNMNYDLDPELEASLFFADNPIYIKCEPSKIEPVFYGKNMFTFSINIGIKLDKGAIMPSYASDYDSGADIFCKHDVYIPAGVKGYIIKTGVRLDIPNGFEVQVRPKSGVSTRTNLRVILGTIDSGYKGEIGIMVDNIGDTPVEIPRGKAIAQLVLASVPKMIFNVKEELSTSERGENGFGSTGRGI